MGYKILHVAAHYGGGVGSIIKTWIKYDQKNQHSLSYLNAIPENDKSGQDYFNSLMVARADFVLCHVWNHPALFEFLVTEKLPPCRMIGWSHMSGLHAPYMLFNKLVNYFDEFVYTSPVSNLTGIIKEYIWSTCDIKDFLKLKKKNHDGFNIGYIGTLDYCKLHPDFLKICQKINIPDVKFIIVGSGCDAEEIKREVVKRGMNNKFVFTGIVSDIRPILSTFDVFLYPLYEKHFGTCEQVLGEAMAAGITCVVLNNEAERFIISNGVNGFICRSVEDIPDIINGIYRKEKSINPETAKRYAEKRYSVKNKINSWNDIFDRLILQKKTMHTWNNIFIESLGGNFPEDRRKIKELIGNSRQWKSESKGSIKQYAGYFPDDKFIKDLTGLL